MVSQKRLSIVELKISKSGEQSDIGNKGLKSLRQEKQYTQFRKSSSTLETEEESAKPSIKANFKNDMQAYTPWLATAMQSERLHRLFQSANVEW